jgi:hypothetical protein
MGCDFWAILYTHCKSSFRTSQETHYVFYKGKLVGAV